MFVVYICTSYVYEIRKSRRVPLPSTVLNRMFEIEQKKRRQQRWCTRNSSAIINNCSEKKFPDRFQIRSIADRVYYLFLQTSSNIPKCVSTSFWWIIFERSHERLAKSEVTKEKNKKLITAEKYTRIWFGRKF